MTQRHSTKRRPAHLALAIVIALAGALAVMAGGVLPAAADSTPTVTNVSPDHGPLAGGTEITITGTNFASGATVTIGSQAATSVVVVNSTTITATTPANASPGPAAIVVTVGPEDSTGTASFTYEGPVIMSISPTFGLPAGGTDVTIIGRNFGTSPTVTVGGNAASIIGTPTSTSIQIVTPSGSLGAAAVVVTSGGHASNNDVTFTYSNMPPAATCTFSSADYYWNPGGNGTLTINRANGSTTTASYNPPVSINVTNWGNIHGSYTSPFLEEFPIGSSSISPSYAVLSTAGGLTGTATILNTSACAPGAGITTATIHVSGGTPAPNISYVSPTSGPVGTTLTLHGSNFQLATGITVGGIDCPIQTPGTDTLISCTTQGSSQPLGTLLDVTISTDHGSDTDTNAFFYTTGNAVSVTNVNPNICPLGGGTTLYVTGTGFATNATSVRIGGVIATNVSVVSGSELTVVCPAQTSYGTYSLIVTVGGVSSLDTAADNVTYQAAGAAPVITDVDPDTGSTSGGTAVTITGRNFTSPASVTFDGIAATSIAVTSSTTITAVTPAHAAGLVTVAVSTGSGTDSEPYAFTYTTTASPTVTSLSPTSGNAGTSVTIKGTNFSGATKVTFGGVSATFSVTANNTIVATVPAGTPLGTVDVRVTTPAGTSPNTAADDFNNTTSRTITITLQGRFTLIGWVGADNLSVTDALRGGSSGPQGGTNDITAKVSVVWGFDSATQTFQAYFPGSANVLGANDLETLRAGRGYFVGLTNPNTPIQWTYAVG